MLGLYITRHSRPREEGYKTLDVRGSYLRSCHERVAMAFCLSSRRSCPVIVESVAPAKVSFFIVLHPPEVFVRSSRPASIATLPELSLGIPSNTCPEWYRPKIVGWSS